MSLVCARAPEASRKIDLPWAGRALVVGDRGFEQRGDVLAHKCDGGVDIKGRDRIALLRHGARRPAPLVKGLIDLGDLGLHQKLHVHGNLAKGAGQEPEKAGDLADAIAHRVPGDLRLGEAELLHQRGLHLESVTSERRQRPDCAAELADQDARLELRQPLAVALHRREQRRRLEAEGERHRLLQVAAAGHRSIAIAPGKIRERGRDRLHVLFDELERGADLHDRHGVGDVLRGGAPVAPFTETVGAKLDDLLHDA